MPVATVTTGPECPRPLAPTRPPSRVSASASPASLRSKATLHPGPTSQVLRAEEWASPLEGLMGILEKIHPRRIHPQLGPGAPGAEGWTRGGMCPEQPGRPVHRSLKAREGKGLGSGGKAGGTGISEEP